MFQEFSLLNITKIYVCFLKKQVALDFENEEEACCADQTAVRDRTCRRFGYGQKKGTLFYERRRASLITVVSMKKFAQCL